MDHVVLSCVLLVDPADLFDGRPFTPGTFAILRRFLNR
jgi:hypothetical protein